MGTTQFEATHAREVGHARPSTVMTAVALFFHWDYIVITLVFHCYYTVVTLSFEAMHAR
jgi:hypothetical protein